MKIHVLSTLILAIGAAAASGCREAERPIGGQGPPASLNEKANLSNPLKVVGEKGKPRLADRRASASQRPGR